MITRCRFSLVDSADLKLFPEFGLCLMRIRVTGLLGDPLFILFLAPVAIDQVPSSSSSFDLNPVQETEINKNFDLNLLSFPGSAIEKENNS